MASAGVEWVPVPGNIFACITGIKETVLFDSSGITSMPWWREACSSLHAFELCCYRGLVRVCHGWREKLTKYPGVLSEIDSVLMLRKSMAERKVRFFGHIV